MTHPMLSDRIFEVEDNFSDSSRSTPLPRRRLTQRELRVIRDTDSLVCNYLEKSHKEIEGPKVAAAFEALLEAIRNPNKDRKTLERLVGELQKVVADADFTRWDDGCERRDYAFVAGQREGFRIACALMTHLRTAPAGQIFESVGLDHQTGMVLLIGAQTDDRQADILIGYLVHGGPPELPPELAFFPSTAPALPVTEAAAALQDGVRE